jgi:hypothetical protein
MHYNCFHIPVLVTLKMATLVAETCRWLQCNKNCTHKLKCILSVFVGFLFLLIQLWQVTFSKMRVYFLLKILQMRFTAALHAHKLPKYMFYRQPARAISVTHNSCMQLVSCIVATLLYQVNIQW